MPSLSVGAILTLRDEMSARLDRARNTAKQFVDQIHAGVSHVDKFTSSVSQAGAKMLQHFGESARAMVDKFFSTIKIGAGLAGAAIGAFAFKGIEASMGFEAQIRHATGLLVASGASSDQADAAFKQFSEGILSAAPDLAKTPEELAQSLYLPLSVMVQYGDVGASVTDTLKVVTAASKAATAGFADATTVTTALSRVLGAYGASADEATHYTDIMQQAVNYGLMTFSDLASGIGKVAGPAAALHIPFEQVAAAIATITRRGILPDEAFTALNKFMLAVEKPHPEAIDNLKAMFGDDWQKHFSATALAANGLSGVLDDLMGHVKPTKDQLAELSQATDFGTDEDVRAAGANILGSRVDQLIGIIGDVRGLRGVLALTATDGNTSFAQALGLTADSVGAVDKQFNEYRKTTQYAKDQFTSFVDVLKESVFGGVLPGLGDRFKSMSASMAELTANPIFQNADVGGKLKMIGSVILDALSGTPELIGDATSALWHGVTGWWSDHEDEIQKDIKDFFDWLGDVAIPFATDAAVKLGAFLAPAMLKSLASVLSTPTGLATAGLLLGLKIVVPAVLSGAGGGAEAAGGAALSGAAAELSGAAAALVSAAEALGGEGAAGGLAGAGGGLAGAAEKEAAAAGVWASATWLQRLGSVSLIAASVYMVGKTYVDTLGEVNHAEGVQDRSIQSALGAGNYGGVAATMAHENAVKAGQNWAADFSEAVGNIIGFSSAQEDAKKSVQTYVGNTLKSAFERGDLGAVQALQANLKSSGVWDQLGSDFQSVITDQISRATGAIRDSHAADELLSILHAGFDLSSILPDYQVDKLRNMPVDEQKAAIDDMLAQSDDIGGFADKIDAFVQQVADPAHQQAFQTNANLYQTMADTLRSTNPGLATFFQTMAGLLGTLANWTPPPWVNQTPVPSPGGAIAQPTGPGGAYQVPVQIPGQGGNSDAPKLGYGHPQAFGGFGTAFRRTNFTAGEAGAEDFAFAPHSKGGMAALIGGAGGLVVHGPLIGHATVREEADIEKIAARLAWELDKRSANASRGTSEP